MKEVRIYRSDIGRGCSISAWREMAAEIWNCGELTRTLFLRSFKAKYRQTALGFLWILIMPIMMVATFIFLNRAGVLNVGEIDIPYPPYALMSLTIWQLFAGGLVSCTHSVSSGGSMVAKINFPKEALVLSSLGETILDVMVRLVMTGIVFAFFKVIPAWTSILLPLSLIPLLLFTLGLGLVFSVLNVLIRDLGQIITLSNTFLLLITPVLYQEPETGPLKVFAAFNPLTALVGGPRDIVFKGYLTHPLPFIVYSGFSILLFLTAWRLFHISEERIAERMGAR